MTTRTLTSIRSITLAAAALLLQACAADPRVLHFGPGKASDFADCGRPAPVGDATTEFRVDDRRYRMLWVKGTLCESSEKGAFLGSYVWGASPSSATHVLVDRSGVLMDDIVFGPVAQVATERQAGMAATADAFALALIVVVVGVVAFVIPSWRARRRPPQVEFPPKTPEILLEGKVWPHVDVVRALGAGAVMGVTNRFPMNVVDPHHPPAAMKQLLDESWHIFNADDLEDQFTSLLTAGHAEVFDWMIEQSFEVSADALPERLAEHFAAPGRASEFVSFAANLGPAVRWLRERGHLDSDADLRRGTSGYDIDRAIMLVRAGLGAGYLSRRSALDMILHAAAYARARFGSWREFGTSVLLGRAIWGGVDDAEGLFAERAEVVALLLDDPRSPWVTAGWWAPQSNAAAADDAGPGEADDPGRAAPPKSTLH